MLWMCFFQQRVVSIHRPLGYEPNTLPLRHAAIQLGFFEFSFSIGIQGIEPCLADQKVLPCFLYTIRLPRLLFWRNHSFFLGFEPNHNIRNTPYCFPNDCLYGAITPMDIPGIEPGFTAHKTVVLPLYYTSAYQWWGSNPRSLRRGS